MIHAARRADRNLCASNVGQIGTALNVYAEDNQGSFPVASDRSARWLPGEDETVVSNSTALFRVVQENYISPAQFQCPAMGGEAFVVRAGMTDFPSAGTIWYSYRHAIGPGTVVLNATDLVPLADKDPILADASPNFSQGTFDPEKTNSDNHDTTGQNTLFRDSHVEFTLDPNVGIGGDNMYLRKGTLRYTGIESPADDTDAFLLPAWSGP